MKDGCVYCGIPGRFNNVCALRVRVIPDSYSLILCKGTAADKKKCPEWAAAVAAEEYYKQKIKQEKTK